MSSMYSTRCKVVLDITTARRSEAWKISWKSTQLQTAQQDFRSLDDGDDVERSVTTIGQMPKHLYLTRKRVGRINAAQDEDLRDALGTRMIERTADQSCCCR